LNCGQALPEDLKILENLKQYISDTLVIHKISDSGVNLEIKLINPCYSPENEDEIPRFDGLINYIEIRMKDRNYSDSLVYYNSGVAMSLINLTENNVVFQSITQNKNAVFISFSYCGTTDPDEERITYIVFYDRKKYLFDINLRVTETEYFRNYQIVDDLYDKLKDLPEMLKRTLIKHLHIKHEIHIKIEE